MLTHLAFCPAMDWTKMDGFVQHLGEDAALSHHNLSRMVGNPEVIPPALAGASVRSRVREALRGVEGRAKFAGGEGIEGAEALGETSSPLRPSR
jgi:hypothetical protein